ncbi:MAG: hypothetical protein C5B55_15145 [Blastocatellia bacterium]|nr:MAG: hypothetical protein C5B55_15145 [Blastocatellia bacterium]
MLINLLKSILHNLGVVLASLTLAYLASFIDTALGFRTLDISLLKGVGVLLITAGFLLRVWAVTHFYTREMRVISLEPQSDLVTDGPYRYSRNPLYLGGNVFCFFGAGLLLGSPTMLALTAIHLPFIDLLIRREERQLQEKFGSEFREYKQHVRRWV